MGTPNSKITRYKMCSCNPSRNPMLPAMGWVAGGLIPLQLILFDPQYQHCFSPPFSCKACPYWVARYHYCSKLLPTIQDLPQRLTESFQLQKARTAPVTLPISCTTSLFLPCARLNWTKRAHTSIKSMGLNYFHLNQWRVSCYQHLAWSITPVKHCLWDNSLHSEIISYTLR